jgi:hypothetical protein
VCVADALALLLEGKARRLITTAGRNRSGAALFKRGIHFSDPAQTASHHYQSRTLTYLPTPSSQVPAKFISQPLGLCFRLGSAQIVLWLAVSPVRGSSPERDDFAHVVR